MLRNEAEIGIFIEIKRTTVFPTIGCAHCIYFSALIVRVLFKGSFYLSTPLEFPSCEILYRNYT